MKINKMQVIKAVKFLAFSLSAGVIQIASFEILQLLSGVIGLSKDSDYWFCYLVSLFLSVLWNFTFNRKFTFKSAANVPIAMLKVLAYYAVFTPVSLLWGNALEAAGWNETVVLLITMVINFVTEFLYDDFIVFRKKKCCAEDENTVTDVCEKESESCISDLKDVDAES